MNLFELDRGDAALVIDVPHAGTRVPSSIASAMEPAAGALPDTDWHVDKLCAFACDAGATLMVATHSRYVVDLNRDPGGAVLYAGADNTEIVPTRTFDNAPIWRAGREPGRDEVAERTATYFTPYHATLAAEIERVKARHGYAVLLDAHSIRSHVPRFFAGRLPDLNLGTADGRSAEAGLVGVATRVLASDARFSSIVDGRFKGGWITRHYGRPAAQVHALQLETAQCAYMDETPPWPWDAARAAPFAAVLRRLVDALCAWRPQAVR